jgi:hypothetical protein
MKRIIWIILSLLLIIVSAGCQKTSPKDNAALVKGPELNTVKSSDSLSTDEKVISESGVYTGQIDNNSIEIKINGTAMAFRFTDASKASFEQLKLKEMDNVTVYYFKNSEGQNIILKIEKANKK